MELRDVPAATDIRVIVGDTHGDHANMLRALRRVGAIDQHGARAPGYWTCHVGDVIHAGHGVQQDDQTLLLLRVRTQQASVARTIASHTARFD